MTKWTLLLAASAATLAALPALGGTVLCPDGSRGAVKDDRSFQLTTAEDSTCLLYGEGNLQGEINKSDQFTTAFPEFQTLDKDPGNALPGIENLFSVDGLGSNAGTLSIDASLWTQFTKLAIGFKTGNSGSPDWAVFELASGTTSGSWLVLPKQGGGLSHANLYGVPVPEPATLALFGLGALGAGVMARRRRRG